MEGNPTLVRAQCKHGNWDIHTYAEVQASSVDEAGEIALAAMRGGPPLDEIRCNPWLHGDRQWNVPLEVLEAGG